jgi:hypothetical protein
MPLSDATPFIVSMAARTASPVAASMPMRAAMPRSPR